jgi:hypothetical protein
MATLRGYSTYGVGLRTTGYAAEPPGMVDVTLWLTCFYFPLVPLRRALCRFGHMSESFIHREIPTPVFEIVLQRPLSCLSVVTTWFRALATSAVLLGPLGYLIFATDGRAATTAELVIVFTCITCVAAFPLWRARRERLFLESTWEPEYQQQVFESRVLQKEMRRIARERHSEPFAWFVLSLAGSGAAGGLILAVQCGWGPWLTLLAVGAGPLLAIAVILMTDRAMKQRRRIEHDRSYAGRSDYSPNNIG